jgi:hypothetical protein
MYLDKFVHTSTGRIIMSVILGLGLATFFRAICKGKRCRITSSPPLEEIEDQTYRFNDKCYKLEKNAVKCGNAKNIVKIA